MTPKKVGTGVVGVVFSHAVASHGVAWTGHSWRARLQPLIISHAGNVFLKHVMLGQ